MKIAICDPEAFYPLRNFVSGRFHTWDDLAAIERFIRTVVLHDEMVMELTPLPYDPETDFEDRHPDRFMVITALGPALTGFDFFSERTVLVGLPVVEPSPALVEIASEFANAGPGNAYFKTHIEYLTRILSVAEHSGSALVCSDFGQKVFSKACEYPESLFEHLDNDWQRYARNAQRDRLGLLVPPLLGVVLTRCARRDAIPTVIRDLRDEWADARRKVWKLLDALRVCRTLQEATDIQKELSSASQSFSPSKNEADLRPIRILWEIVAAATAGAAVSEISGGKPLVGATTGAIAKMAVSTTTLVQEFGPALFGRGAFDLANKVRHEVSQVEFDALSRLLTENEKRKLGL